MKSIKSLGIDKLSSMEYLHAFNPSATKMVIIKQPDIGRNIQRESIDTNKKSVLAIETSKYLEKRLNIDIGSFKKHGKI